MPKRAASCPPISFESISSKIAKLERLEESQSDPSDTSTSSTIKDVNDEEIAFDLISSYVSKYKKFNLIQHVNKLTLSNAGACPEEELAAVLEKIIDTAYENARKEGLEPTKFGLLLNGTGLVDPIAIPIRPREQNTADSILSEIDKLEISEKKFTFLNNVINIIITTVSDPKGAGKATSFNPKEQFNKKASQRIEIQNNDSYCLFYACELSRLFIDTKIKKAVEKGKIKATFDVSILRTHSQLRTIFNNVKNQREIVHALMLAAGIPGDLNEYGIEHLKILQEYYNRIYPGFYRIVLMDDTKETKPLYTGTLGNLYEVPILLEEKHFVGLKSISSYYNCRKYCPDCGLFYGRDSQHTGKCTSKCLKCSRMGAGPCPLEKDVFIFCDDCQQEFYNKDCYQHHSANGTCTRYKKCEHCEKVYRKGRRDHVCGEKYCPTCFVYHLPSRGCFVQPLGDKPDKSTILMVFDFETTQDLEVKEGVTEHVVNAVSARWCCTHCASTGPIPEESSCSNCIPQDEADSTNDGKIVRSKYFSMYDTSTPLEDFVNWLLNAFSSSQTVTVFSHNGGRFDSHFVLRQLYARKLAPRLIMTGNKIYQMKVQKSKTKAWITFRDSYLLMMSPLDSLKKTFGLSTQPKPFFPYLYNTVSNKDAELDCLPPPEMYIPNGMMEAKRKSFFSWYEQNKDTPFSLKTSFKEYVENDTAILLEAVVKMRQILIDITKGFDPFISSCTIAGLAMKTFRKLFLKEEEIAIVPEKGYERADKASDIAVKMLEWMSMKEKVHIKHAGNGREKSYRLHDMLTGRASTAKVDGYVEEQDRVIEILGCYYHGCPRCNQPNDFGANGKLASDNYNSTMYRLECLKQQVSRVDVIWECDIRDQLAKDKQMKDFFTDCQTQGRIDPLDAYFGGLTCAFSMKDKADDKHELSMFDIVSLYPYCNYTGPYPVGHPEIITPTVKEVDWKKPEDVSYRGLIKARVIPPRGLYVPQIPVRIPGDDRLLFCLCIPCAKALKDQNKKQFDSYSCPHTEKERAFTTTLSDIELKEALMHGYRVTHVYRAWHYDSWSSDIFRGYVKLLMKLKVENSEFPEGVSTDEEKQRFAKEYKEKLDIEIDITKVGLNFGLRYISKILLNSLWGKFSQRNSLCQTKVINNPADFYALRYDNRIEISQVLPMNQDTLRVVYRNKDDFVEENETSNIVISLFTTSIARLKLFSYLRMIEKIPGCKILYVDTDSVLFKHPKGLHVLPLGQFLGEMTKEYAEYDIIEFIAGGPKQYALMLRHKITGEIKYIIKLRGITLNYENSKRIQFDRFKEMVEKFGTEAEEMIECEYNRLGPQQDSKILTKKLTKKYKVVNNKGLVSNDFTLYPFGYK